MCALQVPTRDELLRRFARQQQREKSLLTAELAVAALLLFNLNFPFLAEQWLYTLLILLTVFGPVVLGTAQLVFLKKVRVQDLKDASVLGHYTKDSLYRVVREVFDKLGFQSESVTVFITREKEVNAKALRLGKGKTLPELNAVFLNRSVLHLLAPEELKYIIGHELGHVLKYSSLWDRWFPLHSITACLFSLFLFQWLPLEPESSFMLSLIASAGFQTAIGFAKGKTSQLLEFLCDDCGAQVSNPEAAIRAMLKIGREAEAHLKLLRHGYQLRREGRTVSQKELLAHVESALNFGELDLKSAEQTLSQLVKKGAGGGGVSLTGFYKHVMAQDSVDQEQELERRLREWKALDKLPKLEMPDKPVSALSRLELEELIRILRTDSSKVLFQLPEECADEDSSHPSFSRRVLFLAQQLR